MEGCGVTGGNFHGETIHLYKPPPSPALLEYRPAATSGWAVLSVHGLGVIDKRCDWGTAD